MKYIFKSKSICVTIHSVKNKSLKLGGCGHPEAVEKSSS
jgi:hypothetical protein